MTRFRIAFLVAVCLGFSSCLQDLEGGPGRVQVHSVLPDTLTALSLGSWRFSFDPRLAPGQSSETFELPLSGHLEVGLWGSREGRDTLLVKRWIDVPVGGFTRVE